MVEDLDKTSVAPRAGPPKTSVVIPCRDATYLDATLKSLASQTDAEKFEVIIVDSTGTSLSLQVDPWREHLTVRVIRSRPDSKAGANRNTGAAASAGEFLLFVDADDVVGDGYVRAMTNALESSLFVCARIDLNQLNPGGVARTHPQQTGLIRAEMEFLPFAGAGTMGIRRELFERIGGFDSSLPCYEEADLCWRIQRAGDAPPRFVAEAELQLRLTGRMGARLRKALQFGRTQSLLYRRYRRAGMPRSNAKQVLEAWRWIVGRLIRNLARPSGAGVAWNFGIRAGRLLGSIRHRVLYL